MTDRDDRATPAGPQGRHALLDRLTDPEHRRPLDLATAVAVGLHALSDLRRLPDGVLDGRLERLLRTTADGSTSAADAAAAVRTACAHLATRAHEDAYLALLTARDLAPRSSTPPPAP